MPSHPMGMDRKLHKALTRAGWGHSYTGGGHNRYQPPAGGRAPDGSLLPPLFAPCSPSDVRSTKNLRAIMRRLGIPIS